MNFVQLQFDLTTVEFGKIRFTKVWKSLDEVVVYVEFMGGTQYFDHGKYSKTEPNQQQTGTEQHQQHK